jgi:ABC exporter DevB family membrane fusion protein
MKKIWIGSIVLILALITYAFFHRGSTTSSDAGTSLRLAYVAAEGKLETRPGFDVDVGTGELNGSIARIFVKVGDQVRKGQTVVMLENTDLQAQVEQGEQELVVARARLTELEAGARKEEIRAATARLAGAAARLEEAGLHYRRNRELRQQGAIPQAPLDAAEASFKAAQAEVAAATQQKKLLEAGPRPETVKLYRDQVKLAETTLDYYRRRLDKTKIRSPIDGIVIERYLDEGEGVTPEIPILAIADLSKVWINAEVDETDIGRIHIGDAAKVTSNAYPGQIFQGNVSEIADYAGVRKIRPSNPAVNLGLKVVQVKIALKAPTPLRLGMTVDVKITPKGLSGHPMSP